MSTSTSLYAGAMIRIIGTLRVDNTHKTSVCPVCKKKFTTKFCPDDGAAIMDITKVKHEDLKTPHEMIRYVCDRAGVDSDGFYDDVGVFEYSAGVLLPNWSSGYTHWLDVEDLDFIVDSQDLAAEREDATAELNERLEELLKLFDTYKVPYTVVHGITAVCS